jgi:hypothetical protein
MDNLKIKINMVVYRSYPVTGSQPQVAGGNGRWREHVGPHERYCPVIAGVTKSDRSLGIRTIWQALVPEG